jgi:transcriptional regulator with XRE-family HTH domain
MTLGEKIRRLREARGWTIRELGRHAGVRHGTLYRLESGESHTVGSDTLKRLALTFGVTADYLLGIGERETRNQRDTELQPAVACALES